MFNRPGPRLVDAFEWLVWFLNHPKSSSPLDTRNPPQHLASFPWRPWTSSSRRPPAIKAHQPEATVKRGPGYPTCMPPGGLSPDIEEAHRAAVWYESLVSPCLLNVIVMVCCMHAKAIVMCACVAAARVRTCTRILPRGTWSLPRIPRGRGGSAAGGAAGTAHTATSTCRRRMGDKM